MPRRCDIWRVGIVPAPIGSGVWRDDVLHLFVEAYDYRTRHGVIDLLRLDAQPT